MTSSSSTMYYPQCIAGTILCITHSALQVQYYVLPTVHCSYNTMYYPWCIAGTIISIPGAPAQDDPINATVLDLNNTGPIVSEVADLSMGNRKRQTQCKLCVYTPSSLQVVVVLAYPKG